MSISEVAKSNRRRFLRLASALGIGLGFKPLQGQQETLLRAFRDG